jgi:hypothetical protein
VRGNLFGDPRLPARFWAKVSPEPNSGCWLWLGAVAPYNYGQFWLGRLVRCHRLVYETLVAPVPADAKVCHRCDNPNCCNPDHLWLGSHSDNMRDMFAKGRMVRRPWKKVCKRGHPRVPSNLAGADCLECRRLRQRVEYLKEIN